MASDDARLTPVLGNRRVLMEAAGHARSLVVRDAGAVVEAVAAYEPLYGPYAEAALLLRPPAGAAVVGRALDAVRAAAGEEGILELRFVVEVTQAAFAEQVAEDVPGAELRDHALTVPTAGVARGEPLSGTRPTPDGGAAGPT